MPNLFLNPNWISMKVLNFLVNSLTVTQYMNTDWEKDFDKEFAPGATIQVKFPQSLLVRRGLGYNPQGLNRISTTISADQIVGIDFEFDDYERAVKLERSEKELDAQYFMPRAKQLAQEFDTICAQWAYQNTSNVVGVLGTDPTTVATYYAARRRLKELSVPEGDEAMCISSSMMAALGGGLTSIFQPPSEISKIFKTGALGTLSGFDFYESNSLFTHTTGVWANVVGNTVNGAGQSGNSLTVTMTAGDTVKKGDKFSVANMNQVNPRTRRSAGPLTAKQFTITSDLTAVGGGADVIQFLPAIFPPGSQYQNVDSFPGTGAVLTLWPGSGLVNATAKSGTVGLGLTKYAFALVGVKMFVPTSTEYAGQSQDPSGLAVRVVKAWDPVRSMNVNRTDTIFGLGNLYQDNAAVCVAGA